MPGSRRTFAFLAVALTASALGALLAAGTASAQPTPNHFCRTVHAHRHGIRGVDGYTPADGRGCRFMRRSTVGFLETGHNPRGWRCLDLGDSGGCDRRRSKAYFEWYKLD